MARVVVSEFLTLDGVFEDPGGAEDTSFGGWSLRFDSGAEGRQFKFAELMAAEALLLGRITYEGFAEAWPARAGADAFSDKMNDAPKYVVSTGATNLAWKNSTVLSGSPAQSVAALRERLNGDILVAGSGQLVSALLEADLIDELRLMISPIVLGRGRRLFARPPERCFMTTAAQRAGDCTVLTLHPIGRT